MTDGSVPMSDNSAAAAKPTVTLKLPALLVDLFPGSTRRLDVEASTVGEALDALNARWPGMRDRLCDSLPCIRRHINVFIDGERATLETPLKPAAEIFILTAISGG